MRKHPHLFEVNAYILLRRLDEDVAGSPYAVYSYELDVTLGKPEELAEIKARLNRQCLGLILDFAPNHVSMGKLAPWMVRSS